MADWVERWGIGGALAELQQLAEVAPLPVEAEAVIWPLAGLVAQYAPTASMRAAGAWRSSPCPLCEAEAGRRG